MNNRNENSMLQCLRRGEEMYIRQVKRCFLKRHALWQYNYRHTDGELFACIADTLEECRKKKDEWIINKAN